MDEKAAQQIQHLLSKDVLKDNLTKAGLYALAYETLKNSIIEKPKGFFSTGGTGPDDVYKTEILSRHANPLIASCRWFEENGAISGENVTKVLDLREHRNHIAHELANVLLDPQVQVDEERLLQLFQLLCKIDRWWITQFSIPTNPEFDGEKIDPAEVRSLGMEFLWYLISVVYDLDQAFTLHPESGSTATECSRKPGGTSSPKL